MLTKVTSSFEGENMQTKYDVLGHGYKLPVETNKNWHSSRKIDYDIKNKKQ